MKKNRFSSSKYFRLYIGNKLRECIKKRGISIAELARRTKIDASSLGRYTRGRNAPSLEIICALAFELETSVSEIVGV